MTQLSLLTIPTCLPFWRNLWLGICKSSTTMESIPANYSRKRSTLRCPLPNYHDNVCLNNQSCLTALNHTQEHQTPFERGNMYLNGRHENL